MRSGLRVFVGVCVLAGLSGLGYFMLVEGEAPPSTTPDDTVADPVPPTITAGARDPRPNILLFTIDTLRADHLSSYGYERDTSPAMDALAARGTRFTRAYSTASWTLPAVASLVSGVLPSEHGVTHSGVASTDTAEQDMLSPRLPNIAAMLHDAGYRTVGVTANTHLLGETGFNRGFDDYECTDFPSSDEARAPIWRRLEELQAGDRPYFLWVHLTDPHVLYHAREPQFSRWWPASRPRYPILDRSIYVTGILPPATAQGIAVDEALAYATAEYDSEIRAADDFLRDLLLEIDDGNLAIVLTVDHGEELNDHHQMGHGTTLFEEVAHVPLIVALPRQTPSVVTTPVSILDVLPTIAEVSGTSAVGAAGISLVPATHGDALPERDILMESGRTVLVQAIVRGQYKYGVLLRPSPLEVLYDLEADPHERHDLMAEHPEIAAPLRDRMHAGLDAAHARRPEMSVAHIELPEEIRARLRALGYGN